MAEKTKKTTNTPRNLIILVIGVVMFVSGRVVIIDGLIHDVLILGGAIVFLVGLVGTITSLSKKK